MALSFGAVGAKSAGGTTTVSVAYPASISAGNLLIAARAVWLNTATCTAETGWTVGPDGTGGVNSASGDHTTRIHGDYLEATGSESGSVTFDQGGTISGAVGQMARYTKGAGTTWNVQVVSGRSSDGSHGANRGGADTTGTIDIAVGDIVVAIVSVDVSTSLTITGPLYQVAGGTGRDMTRRTSGAGVATGLTGNVEIFDRVATNAESGVIAFGMTTATLQCGAAAFLRLREVVPPSAGTGSGTTTYTGSATGARASAGTATGTTTYTGSAAGASTPKGSGSGTTTFTGSATGTRTSQGSATGSATWTGSAAGKRTPKASASGTTTYTGTAAGQRIPKGSATGTVTYAGSATGEAPTPGVNSGFAAGVTTWTGAATGQRTPRGTASGVSTWTGAAFGSRASSGTASGDLTYTGSATGERASIGEAAGTLTYTGTAEGEAPPDYFGPVSFTMSASVSTPTMLVTLTAPTISGTVTTPRLEASIE